MLMACAAVTLSACAWMPHRGHTDVPGPVAEAEAPRAAEAPAKPTDGPVPALEALAPAPASAPASTSPASPGAPPAESGKSRIEQVKEIMATKNDVEKLYETKKRASDPNGFYRYKVEAKETTRLVDDGIHDPKLDLGELQQPLDAFKSFPTEMFGNSINWVKALHEQQISPRADRRGEKQQFVMDMSIQMPVAGTMNDVVFPHKIHTEWLACQNCHTAIFQMQRGANPITMEKIVKGEFCGVCHGKVAFPIANCNRCHSAKKKMSASNK
jgi:c(7)-type cytochrome triheme protein